MHGSVSLQERHHFLFHGQAWTFHILNSLSWGSLLCELRMKVPCEWLLILFFFFDHENVNLRLRNSRADVTAYVRATLLGTSSKMLTVRWYALSLRLLFDEVQRWVLLTIHASTVHFRGLLKPYFSVFQYIWPSNDNSLIWLHRGLPWWWFWYMNAIFFLPLRNLPTVLPFSYL